MSIKTAYSCKESVPECMQELQSIIKSDTSKLDIFFASSTFDSSEVSMEIQKINHSAQSIGCTTAGELVNGKMLKNSIVGMSIDESIIDDIAIEVVDAIATENNVDKAFKSFEDHFDTRMNALDIEKYIGIILIDGLQSAEEKIMEKIGDLTDITFIGGSAGDDLAFKKTYVFANGKAYTNAAVLAVLKLKKGFDIIKTQSFSQMDKSLKATKVNEEKRTVYEFDNRPAAEVYAEALSVPVNDASNNFMVHPVGLVVSDGQPFVRSPQQILETGIVFYCNIKEGMDLTLLQSTDIPSDTRKAIENKISELGSVQGMINFHCILRTLELEQKGQTEEYGKIFSNIPTIGFSTYGEEYIGHINQTSTILVFK